VDQEFLCSICHDVLPSQRNFINLLNRLIIKCEFTSNGCKSSIELEDLAAHEKNCVFNRENQEISCEDINVIKTDKKITNEYTGRLSGELM
jgi:hypothetical protein